MKKRFIIIALLLTTVCLVSQEIDITLLSEKEIIKFIDQAVESRDESIINYMGSLGTDFPSYSKIETYILGKARDLIAGSDLSYPLKIVEAVLYNNLENDDAQKLYSSIINKKIELEERLQAEKLKADLKREELKLLAESIDKAYEEDERLASIVGINQEMLSTINGYIDSFDKTHYVSNSYFYPIFTRFYQSEVYDGFYNRESTINSYNGFAVEFGIGIELRLLTFRMDLTGNFSYNDLLNDSIKQGTGAVTISTGMPIIPIPLFLRTGFLYDLYLFDNMANSEVAITNLPTATLGLGITGLRFLKIIKIDLSTDFLMASTYTDNLDLGLFSRGYLTVNLLRFGIYNLEIRGGLDHIFYSEGGLSEYSITPRFGFGISSYE